MLNGSNKDYNKSFVLKGYASTTMISDADETIEHLAYVYNKQEKDEGYIYTLYYEPLEIGSCWNVKGLHFLIDEEIVIKGNVLEETDEEVDVFVKQWEHTFKWSEIFIAIAPTFLETRADHTAKDEIGNILFEIVFPDESYYYGEISDKSFNMIKIQFMALGLINISDKYGIKWKLSDKGVKKMLELGAVKTVKE